jgi:hypothetical protein
LYEGRFCLTGEVARIGAVPDAALDASRFGFAFTASFPWPADTPRKGMVAVEFLARLPWSLPDERPG